MSQIARVFHPNGLIATITGDAGGALSPDGVGNIDILGGTGISTSGAGNVLTITASAAVATSYLTDDANTAVPALNVLTVAGGTNLGTTSAGSTVTINLDDTITLSTVNATTFDTNVAAAGLTLSGTSLLADGTDADIDINITAKGSGQVIIDDLNISGLTAGTLRSSATGEISSLADGVNGTLLIGSTAGIPVWATLTDGNNITATEGANSITLDLTGTTEHAVQVGSAAGALTSLGVATDGQIPIGSSGADPVLGNITSLLDTLSISNGAGTLNIDTYDVLQTDTGFGVWDGGAPYFDDTVLGDFTLSQSGSGYIKGVPVSWTAPQTVSGLTAGNTYLIYIDNTGTIGKTTDFSLASFQDYIPLFECMRDSTLPTNNQVTVKENHPYGFPVEVSSYCHDVIGTVIENRNDGANITLNGTQKIEIVGDDELSDHGLYTDIPDSAGVAVSFVKMYTNASGKWARQNYSDTFSGYWNNAGTPELLGASKYAVYTLYVSKDNLNSAIPVYGAVLDTSQYNNLTAANTAISNGTTAKATNEVSSLENAQLGYIIYSESSSSIVEVVTAKSTLGQSLSTSGTNIAALVTTNITNFDGILSASDTTVQSALETIDEWGKTTTDHAVLIGNGTGSPIGSLAVGATGETLMGSTGADPGWTGSPSFSGSVTAGTGLTVTANDLTVSSGSLNIPTTTSTDGQIIQNGQRFFHTYGVALHPTDRNNNIFIGSNAGNFTLTPASSEYNVIIGNGSGKSLTSGANNASLGTSSLLSATSASANLAIGTSSLFYLQTGSNNTSVSLGGLINLVSGSYNISIGRGGTAAGSGSAYTTSESSNICISNIGVVGESNTIRIGTQGTGNAQQDTTYIAGIYGVTPAGTLNVAYVDSNGQLGSVATLGVANGGTGAATLTDHGVLVGSGTGAITATAAGTAGQILASGGAASDPLWTTATYPSTVAVGTILIASAADTITTLAPNTAGYVLTDNGAGVAPSWQANTAGIVQSVTGGTNISTSGTAAEPIVDLDASITGMTSVTFSTGGSLQTGTTATNSLLLQAYDVDGTAYVPFVTLTAADTPTCDLDTAVTIGTKYIYRADGTDIPVADGGTGASTLTDNGVLYGNGTSAIAATAEGASGEILQGSTGNPPTWLAAGTTDYVLTANGAGSAPSWQAVSTLTLNDQTGTTYTLALTDAGKLVTLTNGAAITLTVPKNSVVAFDIGAQILLYQGGAGAVTISPVDGDVTIRSADSLTDLYAQYSMALLTKIATDTWSLSGDLN